MRERALTARKNFCEKMGIVAINKRGEFSCVYESDGTCWKSGFPKLCPVKDASDRKAEEN